MLVEIVLPQVELRRQILNLQQAALQQLLLDEWLIDVRLANVLHGMELLAQKLETVCIFAVRHDASIHLFQHASAMYRINVL